MLLGLEVNIVMDFAAHGAGAHIRRNRIRNDGVDVPAVTGKTIFAVIAEIADIIDATAG